MQIIFGLIKQLFYWILHRVIARRDSRNRTAKWFPTCFGRNFLYDSLFPEESGRAYFTKYHAEKPGNPLAVDFKRYKMDILKGRLLTTGQWYRLQVKTPSALPIAVTGVDITQPGKYFNATIRCCGRDLNLGGLVADRYYYLPIREPGEVEIKSDQRLVVADPLPLTQVRRHKLKLVLVLFVDNFSWDILGHLDFARDLPNLHRFFSKGVMFDNCHSSSNWTLTGVGSLVSGKTASNHGMIHSVDEGVFLGEGYRVLPEYFQEKGYMTFQVCSNPRKSPAYRYVRGFDRTVYKMEMSLSEMIGVMLDHLRAFPDRDHFVWTSILDAHHSLAGVPDIANQLSVPLEAHDYSSPQKKSPFKLAADESARQRYVMELKRIDFFLGPIFDWILSQYDDEEILVTLISDHGTGVITSDPHELSHQKTHVPLMLRGTNLPAGRRTDEIVQNTDVLPSILNLAGLVSSNIIDGQVPAILGGHKKRLWVLSESKFPGKKYRATIKDSQFEFYFESDSLVGEKGQFSADRYHTELFRIKDWSRDVSAENPDVVRDFTAKILSHLNH